jgi:hypothetical protein
VAVDGQRGIDGWAFGIIPTPADPGTLWIDPHIIAYG